MSALLTTTMTYMKTVIDGFEKAGRSAHQDGGRRRADQPDVRRRNRRRRLRRRCVDAPSICFLQAGRERRSTRMATYKILYWQEIPSQIKAEDDDDEVNLPLPPSSSSASTRLPCTQACTAADDYLAQWKWGDEHERDGSAEEVAQAVKAELEAQARLVDWAGAPMAVQLHHQWRKSIDGRRGRRRCSTAPSGSASRCRLPAGSRASARSASSKSSRAWNCSRRRPAEESHLKDSFRLSCRCHVIADDGRSSLPHDAPRPDAHRAARVRTAGQPSRT